MSDWIFNDGLDTAWHTPAGSQSVDVMFHPPQYVLTDDGISLASQTPAGSHGLDALNHAPQYLLNDDGQLSLISDAKGGTHPTGGTTTGGTTTGGTTTTTTPPPGTVVGSSTGLQIDLIWDTSVLNAVNAADIENTVIKAAQIFTSNFATHALLNIHVGLGEVAGTAMDAGALGESNTLGYAVSYATVTNALATADAGLVASGQMSAGAATADTALAGKTFYLPNAEAKALGLLSATSAATDGYIGLVGGSALSFNGVVGTGQYDGVGIAAHEIAEVMGRIGSVGTLSGYYLPMDVFRYTSAGHPGLSASSGYFSTNLGVTALNYYNNPSNGGDAGDWASSTANAYDAFDAFGNRGGTMKLSANDLLEIAALGYHPAGVLGAVAA